MEKKRVDWLLSAFKFECSYSKGAREPGGSSIYLYVSIQTLIKTLLWLGHALAKNCCFLKDLVLLVLSIFGLLCLPCCCLLKAEKNKSFKMWPLPSLSMPGSAWSLGDESYYSPLQVNLLHPQDSHQTSPVISIPLHLILLFSFTWLPIYQLEISV